MKKAMIHDGYLMPKTYTYGVFALFFMLYFFDYVDRMVVVSLFPHLKSDWGLSDTQCGLLVSTVYWSIVIFSVPTSIVIDRWSRKKGVGVMAIIWSMAIASCAFTTKFSQLFVTRTAVGVGEAGYAPGGTAMISALFPDRMRSILMGLYQAAIPLGSAFGIILGGIIAARFGWQHAFGLVAIPGFLIAILFFFIRDYKTVELRKKNNAEKELGESMSKKEIVREFTHTPSLIFNYFAFAGSMFMTASYLSWLPMFFQRVHGVSTEKAAFMCSGVMLLAIIGFPLGGFLADRWRKTRTNARMVLPAISAVVTAGIFFTAFQFFEGPLQYGMLLLGGISTSAFSPAAIAVTQDVVHPGLRATSYSLCVIFQNLLGSSMGPLFVGVLSDMYDIRTALTVVTLFGVISAILFLAGSFFYEKDLAKVDQVEICMET